MPAVFYVLGMLFAAICANFTYGAVSRVEMVYTAIDAMNFQLDQMTALGVAIGSGIISAIFFATGAITQAILTRNAE